MLHILAGRAGGGQLDTMLRRMGSSSSPCVLIVPEHYSHETERALCRVLGPVQSARCEVLSFTRLARRVAETVGGVLDVNRNLRREEHLSENKSRSVENYKYLQHKR